MFVFKTPNKPFLNGFSSFLTCIAVKGRFHTHLPKPFTAKKLGRFSPEKNIFNVSKTTKVVALITSANVLVKLARVSLILTAKFLL